MDEHNVNRALERPKGAKNYDMLDERKELIRRSKAIHMKHKGWIGIVCDEHDYKLSDKCTHFCTKRHRNNLARIIDNRINHICHWNEVSTLIQRINLLDHLK